jgi:hypothetical protein
LSGAWVFWTTRVVEKQPVKPATITNTIIDIVREILINTIYKYIDSCALLLDSEESIDFAHLLGQS